MEIARRSFEALARGDFEAAFAEHDASTEWRTAADEPDSRVYRGIEGLRSLVASMAEPWKDRFDDTVVFGDFIARGPWVIVPWTALLHGAGSGVEIEVFETYAVLVRDEKIVRVEEYRTIEEALRALRAPDVGGLDERAAD